MKFSVLLCVYNSKKDAIIYTLDSIVEQNIGEFEIIICDDGSANAPDAEFYKDYFEKKGFDSYKFSFLEKNSGTVRNIIAGLSMSEGRYIKIIGPGDALADENVLRTVYDAMEKDGSVVAYGPMRVFTIAHGVRTFRDDIRVPLMGGLYADPLSADKAKKCMIVYGDNISGAQAFHEAGYCKWLMDTVSKAVTYMEDIGLYIPLLDGKGITFVDKPVILYEGGSGISTSSSNRFAQLLEKDRQNFLSYLSEAYPDNKYVINSISFNKIDGSSGGRLKKALKKAAVDPYWLVFRSKVSRSVYLNSL